MQAVNLLSAKNLRTISHKNQTAEVTMTSLSQRERHRHETNILRTRNKLVRDGEFIDGNDYLQFWKDLQVAGVGTIIYGRHGKADRFAWKYSVKKVASAALEGVELGVEKIEQEMPIRPQLKVVAQERPKLHNHVVFVPLRPDFDVEIKLPLNVSPEEIDTLVKALKRAL